MQAWEAIQKALDYMEEHYEEELTVGQFSTIAHLSRFYYQRLLYRLIGYTISEYLRGVRLKVAAGSLKTNDEKIMDIVVQCGFSSHSILTRVFRQCYGMSSAEYRASSNTHLDHVIKSELCMQYALVDESMPLICDDMVLGIQRGVQKEPLWFSGYIKEDENAKIAQPKKNTLVTLWDRLEQGNILQHAALDEGNDILMSSQTPGAFTYMAVVYTVEPIKEYTASEILVGTYTVCKYEAESLEDLVQRVLYKASIYLFGIWLPRHGHALDAFLVQRYIRLKQRNCRLQLWVKISDSLTL